MTARLKHKPTISQLWISFNIVQTFCQSFGAKLAEPQTSADIAFLSGEIQAFGELFMKKLNHPRCNQSLMT